MSTNLGRMSTVLGLGTAIFFTPDDAIAGMRVVTSVPDLAAIAKVIGGDRVEVSALSVATQDPHFVDARPHLALELSRADLLMVVGLELEVGWLPVLQTGSRNGKIQNGSPGFLDCSQFVELRDAAREKVDRSMGDIHPSGNPHYLYDPRAVVRIAQGVAQRMGELDPPGAKLFRDNAAKFQAAVEDARRAAETRLAGLRGVKMIAYHKTLPYLADWLGFQVVEHLEPKPGIPPNPQHVARVLAFARAQGVRAVVLENYYPVTTAQLVAEKSGASLVRLSGGTDFAGGKTYLDQLERLVSALEPVAKKIGGS